MNVLFSPEVQEYYDKLETILYKKGYFSFKESSKKYVKDLIDDIEITLPIRVQKPAPQYFDRFGKNMKYAAFKKNKTTTWYVFFKTYEENGETVYLVRYIANNHTVAQYL
jgi:hypothetical protein